MEKRNLIFLILLMALLLACIVLMGVSLLVRERTFGQISGYVAIGCIAITLVGVAVIMHSTRHNKK